MKIYKILIFLFFGLSFKLSAAQADTDIELDEFGVNFLYKKGDLPFFIRSVQKLKLDVDESDEAGLRVAHWAAREGKNDWIAVLHWLGADLESPDGSQNWAPIAWAAYRCQKRTLELLLNYGVPLERPSYKTSA